MTRDDLISPELYAAIGEVAVEAARLDYWIASAVMHLEGLTDDAAGKLLGVAGEPLRRLNRAVEAGRSPRGQLRARAEDAKVVLGYRNALLHSVAMTEEYEDGQPPQLVFWHPRSGEDLQDVTVDEVAGLAGDIRRVIGGFARLTEELAPAADQMRTSDDQ